MRSHFGAAGFDPDGEGDTPPLEMEQSFFRPKAADYEKRDWPKARAAKRGSGASSPPRAGDATIARSSVLAAIALTESRFMSHRLSRTRLRRTTGGADIGMSAARTPLPRDGNGQ